MQSPDKPFIVVDGVIFINEGLVRQVAVSAKITSKAVDSAGKPLIEMDLGGGSITLRNSHPEAGNPEQDISCQQIVDPARWSIRLEQNSNGQYVAAGIGLGVSEFEKARAKGAGAVLDFICETVGRSAMASSLRDEIDAKESSLHDAVREVIRKETRPGGMLYRR